MCGGGICGSLHDVVSNTVSMLQAEVLLSELEEVVNAPHSGGVGGTSSSKQWSAQRASVSAQLAHGVHKMQEKDSGHGSQLTNKVVHHTPSLSTVMEGVSSFSHSLFSGRMSPLTALFNSSPLSLMTC